MAGTGRTFRTWSAALPATGRLPEGRAQVTIADRSLWAKVGSPVQAVYITIPGRGDVVARTETFDEERVIVEYDAEGGIMGLELLSLVPITKTPQFRRALRRKGQPVLLGASFHTAHHLWHDLVLALRLAAEVGAEDPKPRVLRRANPESIAWQEDPRNEPLACGA